MFSTNGKKERKEESKYD